MLGSIIGTLSFFLAAKLLTSEGHAPPQEIKSRNLHSSTNLTTSFDPNNVKDITWIRKNEGKEYRIAKIRNGVLVDNYDNHYQQFYNGTVLVISNLTEDDLGLYMAEVTRLDNVMKQEEFNITHVCVIAEEKVEKSQDSMDPRTSFIVPKIFVIVAVMIVVVMVAAVVYWKTSLPHGDTSMRRPISNIYRRGDPSIVCDHNKVFLTWKPQPLL